MRIVPPAVNHRSVAASYYRGGLIVSHSDIGATWVQHVSCVWFRLLRLIRTTHRDGRTYGVTGTHCPYIWPVCTGVKNAPVRTACTCGPSLRVVRINL